MSGRFQLNAQRLALLDNLLRAEGIDRSPSRTIPRRTDPAAPVPLTFSQSRFWFLEQLAERNTAYVISTAMRVHGAFQFDLFARACDDLVRRHETLRTVFFEVDGQPVQQVRDDLRADVRVEDVRGAGVDDVDTEVRRREAELINEPFDLTAGPLFRVRLLRFGEQEAAVLLTMHHIVSDRWSMGVLLRELTDVYGALVAGLPSDLADLPVQYADFAAWQQQSSSDEAWAADLEYWARQLAGAPPELGLPTDRRRPKEKSYHGASVPVEIPPALVKPLRELARSEGVTVFMLLAATFKVLLSRLSGADDVVVGTPVANRTLVELEPLIGLFVNTLALRTDLAGDPTFREALRRVSKVCLEAYDHQSIPFERLVEVLQPERSLASTPVFQVMFSYQNVPFPTSSGGPLRVEPIPLQARKAEFDLLLDLFEDGDTVWGRLEYSVDIFDESTARRVVAMLHRMLRGIVADPDTRVSDLPLMSDDERRQVLAWAAGPQRDWPGVGFVHECVREAARRSPDAVAVRFGRTSMSYAELDAAANRLARRLRSAGVGRDVPVGVSMHRSVDLVVSLLAVLKAGAAFLPLDPGLSPTRLELALVDARPPVVLAQRATALPFVDVDVWCVDELDLSTASGEDRDVAVSGDDVDLAVSGEGLDVEVAGDDAAYLMYTPGPVPKAVVCTHAGLRNRLLWMRDAYRLDADDRVLQKAPFSSDVAVGELFLPLIVGATAVLARPDGHRDARYLVDVIRTERVTTVHFVPSMLRAVLEQRGVERCTALRHVFCDREPLPADVAERFFARSQAELHNLYGPTEAAIDVTAWPCQRCAASGVVPIGFPVANTRVYVLDRFLRPVPVGVPGELYLGGVQVARGYLNRAELTAQRFVEDPFAGGGRLYRTGDVGRLRPDGAVEFLGRVDHQVKLRGFRVELGEIESVLAGCAGVGTVAVAARELGGTTRLVAYVAGEDVPTAGDLLAFARQRLPEYKVPSTVVELPELPRTAIGTLDRDALPDVEISAPESTHVEPRDEVERSIADMWRELLGVERIGVDDTFFALGGHSLLATKLAAQIKAVHGVHLPLRELFDNPTVAALADRVRQRRTGPDATVTPIPRVDRAGDLPLSFAQEHLVRHHPLGPEDPIHNVVTGLTLAGPLDVDALHRALADIVRRHEALRARIVTTASGPVQRIDDPGPWPLDTVDLRTADDSQRPKELAHLIEEHGSVPFRIDAEPPVRGTLARLADDEHALVLVMHHLVTDNWSYGVLVRDLCELYEAHVAGRPATLPELPIQYPDFAAWQQNQLAIGGLDAQLTFWRGRLANLTPLTFRPPETHPVAPATGYTRGFTLDQHTTAGLYELARTRNASLFMVLLAAFDVLLSAYSGSDDIAVSFPEAGRERPETADLVGYFVNHLVVRADLSGGPSFRQVVDRVRDATLDAYTHRAAPLWASGAGGDADPTRILFNLLNAEVPALRLHGLDVRGMDIGNGYVFSEVLGGNLKPAEVDLALIMREHEAGLRGTWLYATEVLDPHALSAMMRHFELLLAWVVADPDADVDGLRTGLTRESA